MYTFTPILYYIHKVCTSINTYIHTYIYIRTRTVMQFTYTYTNIYIVYINTVYIYTQTYTYSLHLHTRATRISHITTHKVDILNTYQKKNWEKNERKFEKNVSFIQRIGGVCSKLEYSLLKRHEKHIVHTLDKVFRTHMGFFWFF